MQSAKECAQTWTLYGPYADRFPSHPDKKRSRNSPVLLPLPLGFPRNLSLQTRALLTGPETVNQRSTFPGSIGFERGRPPTNRCSRPTIVPFSASAYPHIPIT